jgi:hypothetical protein
LAKIFCGTHKKKKRAVSLVDELAAACQLVTQRGFPLATVFIPLTEE